MKTYREIFESVPNEQMLNIFWESGFKVPRFGGGDGCKDMSLHFIHPLSSLSMSRDEDTIAGEKYIVWEEGEGDGEDDCEDMDEWHAVSPEALKLMIDEGVDVNASDASGWTAMHRFAYNCCNYDRYFDSHAMLQILIECGADINARDRHDMTPLMLAAMKVWHFPKALETVKFLLRNGADFEADVVYWMRDFWYGNGFKRRILNEILLTMYFSIQPDRAKAWAKAAGETMQSDPVPLSAANLDLMTAAFWGTADDIAPILARGANIGARTPHEYTALMFSSVWNDASASKFLIEQGAELDAKNDQKSTPLTLAMQTKDLSMIKTLLEAGPKLKEPNRWGRTPLMTLVDNPCCRSMGDLVGELINAGADVNATDEDGLTALMLAARQSKPDIDVAWVLIRAGANVNARSNDGRTALEIALNACSDTGDFVKFLLSGGANPRLMPIERPQIESGAECCTAKMLRRFGLKPRSSFMDVFACNSAEAITAAVKSGLDLSFDDGDKSFFDAVLCCGAAETVQACVDRGVDVNKGWRWTGRGVLIYNSYPESYPLYQAIKAHNAGAVEVLLKAGADANIAAEMDWDERRNIFPEGSATGAYEAAKAFKERLDAGAMILKILREAGADVPYTDGEELTYMNVIRAGAGWWDKAGTLTELRRAVSPETLKLLLAGGADVNARGNKGDTAMHLIARDWQGYFDPGTMVEILIAAGADVNARNNNGTTPLMLLAGNLEKHPGAWKSVKRLLEAGADFRVRRVEKMRSDIQIHDLGSHLAETLRLESLDTLVKAFGSDGTSVREFNEPDKKEEANLFIAAGWGNALEIESALAGGARLNAATGKGYTPLMFASALNNLEAVRCLLRKGADADAENSRRETALTLAVTEGFAEIIQTLAAAGAGVNIRGANGDNLLFHARQEETAVTLIKTGVDFDAKNDNGVTALKKAMGLSRFKIARALLAAGADPSCILDGQGKGLTGNKPEPGGECDEDKKDKNSN